MGWIKLDIENKILIPFVILLIISIVTQGAVSYWNGYQMLLNNEVENMKRQVGDFVSYLNDLNYQASLGFINMETARLTAIKHYMVSGREGGFIVATGNSMLYNSYQSEDRWRGPLLEAIRDNPSGTLRLERDVFVYESYGPWSWAVGYGINKQLFSREVMENQKYMILLAIVSLLFSMQAASFIAYHISKPIRQMAVHVGEIGKGNTEKRIQLNRQDEIGTLARAVNEMMENLEQNRAQLMNMTRLNQDILRNITTGIMTTDESGRLLSLNPAARDLLKLLGETPETGLFLREALQEQTMDTLLYGENRSEVYRFQHLSEPDFHYIDVSTSLIRDEDSSREIVRGAICSFRDITERKRVEDSMEILDRLSSVGQLAAGIAHEIRNPLAGMRTSLQVLQKRLVTEGAADSNQELFLGTIYEIDRINRLISDLLEFARPRKPSYEKTQVAEILKRTLTLTEKEANEKKIEIRLEGEDSLPPVKVDPGQMEQVFLNLIQNAVNAMEMKGTLRIITGMKGTDAFKHVRIDFIDNGKGIPPEIQEKIFHPFFTTNPHGTGLGLSVVYELVKENRGTISVSSWQGRGATFSILLPLYGEEAISGGVSE